MPVLEKIAYFQDRRDEVPNQELAKKLAETKNKRGIKEIAENLWNKNKSVASDCIKVLYEIGYIEPKLISGYTYDFLKLLENKNNRMVWGGMIALSTIAEEKADELWESINNITDAMEKGTLITVVSGVRALSGVVSVDEKYRRKIFPFLLKQLKKCLPRDIPIQTESIVKAVDDNNRQELVAVLRARWDEMKSSQHKRLRKMFKELDL